MTTGILSFLLGFGMITWIAGLLIWILSVAAMWMIFVKAGESGWKSLIPIYNLYILYKVCWNTNVFWAVLVLEILSNALGKNEKGSFFVSILALIIWVVLLIIRIFYCLKLSRAFGFRGGFAVGLYFLNTIFIMILGFGNSRYYGPQ